MGLVEWFMVAFSVSFVVAIGVCFALIARAADRAVTDAEDIVEGARRDQG